MITALNNEKDNMVSNVIRKSIIKRILIEGAFLVSQIAEDTGYSITTVSKYVSEMLDEGVINETDKVSLHAKGRKSIQYGISPDSCYFLGVDPRPYELHIGLVDLTGNAVYKRTYSTYSLENTYESLESLCETVKSYVAELPEAVAGKIKAANVNISGRVNSKKGTSATLFNLEGSESETLADTFSERFGMPVFIENDTKAMAYGEYATTMRGEKLNMCYVNFSWGLGLGIIIDGKLYYGKDGYSGEIGHIHAFDNNVLCHCGKKGCLETELSGSAIARKLKERVQAGETSILSPLIKAGRKVTTADIIGAIEKEDALTIELTSAAGMELGHQLAACINLLNPDRIVIGGNFSIVEPCYFLQYINLAIRQYALKLVSKDLPVVSSTLAAEAGVIGACLIARARYFNLEEDI